MKTIILILALFFSLGAAARELKGVKFPETIRIQGQKLQLVGTGLREVEILHIYINVYVAGLYVQHKNYLGRDISHNGNDIIRSKGIKLVQTQFLHHVSPSQLRDGWQKDFDHNCGDKCSTMKDLLKTWKGFMPSVNSGDSLSYLFNDKGVTLRLKGATLGTIENPGFAKIVLSAFIGAHPATETLKKGLLAQ